MTTRSEGEMTDAAIQDFFMTADEVEAEYGVDLITAETLRHAFIEATRHMHGTLLRSSFSNIIRDGMDFGVCVHLVREDGSTELVGVTEGCTQFAFTHQHMTNMVLDEYGIENLGPGDTLVCNDAFRGGIHFGDLNFFRVIHDDEGKPAFVVSDAAHVFDIGGPVPGGFNSAATSMYEEGLRLGPTLLMSGEKPVRSVFNLLLENTRSPMHMIGDVRALLGTLRTGEERLRVLMDRYGADAARSAARYALGLSERRMRRALLAVPDGDYGDEIFLDDDGVTTDPVRIAVEVRVRGAEAEIDFSGTDPQTLGSMSTGWQEAARAIIGPKVVLDPRHPMNAGAMRPFQVLMPPGSLVLGLPPTSQSNHVETGAKVACLMVRVMSEACRERAVADDSATSGAIIFAGVDSRAGHEGDAFGGALVFGGGWGGSAEADGISFCQSPLYNCRSMIVEFIEKAMPIVIWEHGIAIDSAGPGRSRGGFAAAFSFEALADAFCTPLIDSTKFAPAGLEGGGAGTTSYAMLVRKDERGGVTSWNGILPAARTEPLFGIFDDEGRPDPAGGSFGNGTRLQTGKPTAVPMQAGDVMHVQIACAAGWGDPFERDPEAVALDVRNERVSLAAAADVYGVSIDPATLAVDVPATKELRAARPADSRLDKAPPAHFRAWPLTEEEFEQLATGRPLAGAAA